MGFFDNYQQFLGGISHTGAHRNRLNERYRAIIEFNKNIIKDSSILDLGSHDGRWSFAAIKNGASKVLGIEGRKDLVEHSYKNMEFYGIPKEQYSFIQGDVLEEMKKIQPNTIDVVFCFGFFYHVMYHMELLNQVKRLKGKYLIIDTSISGLENPVIEILPEDVNLQQSGVKTKYAHSNEHLAGYPSKLGLELMLENVGFSFYYYDWQNVGIEDWTLINDYHVNRRLSLVAFYERKNYKKKTLRTKETRYKQLQKTLGIKEPQYNELQKTLGIKETRYKQLQKTLRIKETRYKQLQKTLGIKETRYKQLQKTLGIKETRYKQLQKKVDDLQSSLNKIENSFTRRTLRKFDKFKEKL